MAFRVTEAAGRSCPARERGGREPRQPGALNSLIVGWVGGWEGGAGSGAAGARSPLGPPPVQHLPSLHPAGLLSRLSLSEAASPPYSVSPSRLTPPLARHHRGERRRTAPGERRPFSRVTDRRAGSCSRGGPRALAAPGAGRAQSRERERRERRRAGGGDD